MKHIITSSTKAQLAQASRCVSTPIAYHNFPNRNAGLQAQLRSCVGLMAALSWLRTCHQLKPLRNAKATFELNEELTR
jgi:hypothetical protein